MSQTQFNSTTHGCCAIAILVLAHENKEAFLRMEAGWFKTYQPKQECETGLVHQLITADWLNQRSTRVYAQIEAELYAAEPNPMNWTDEQHKALARFGRYRTTNQNAFKRALKTIEDFYALRANGQLKLERIKIAQARQKIYEQKNPVNPTYEEIIEINRRLAAVRAEQAQQTK